MREIKDVSADVIRHVRYAVPALITGVVVHSMSSLMTVRMKNGEG